MKKTEYTPRVIILLILAAYTLHSCKSEKLEDGTDSQLYEMAKKTEGFSWYKNSSSLLNKSTGSGHPQPLFRTRYNSIASAQLDSTGKIIEGSSFPEESLIVKELYDNSTTLGRYAILYKNSMSDDADANGWVWGYINADGDVAVSASKKGSSCISCHSQEGNIDYMLMNEFFP